MSIKRVISILLVAIIACSCFSCVAFASDDRYGITDHDCYGMPCWFIDDGDKCVIYTNGDMSELVKYYTPKITAPIVAPILYIFMRILNTASLRMLENRPSTEGYDFIEVSNYDYYINYLGEGNFSW